MAVTAPDLTAPAGELDRAILFPADDAGAFTARLTAYLAQGEAKAAAITDADTKDAAVTAWAYYRAYDAVATRMLAEPATQDFADAGGIGFTGEQLAGMQALAATKRAEFDGLVADAEAVQAPGAHLPSASASNDVTW